MRQWAVISRIVARSLSWGSWFCSFHGLIVEINGDKPLAADEDSLTSSPSRSAKLGSGSSPVFPLVPA